MKFVVNPDLQSFLPAQAADERAGHEKSILAEGAWPGSLVTAMVNGQRTLIDGHNTLRLCTENEIDPPDPIHLKQKFENVQEAKGWMLERRRRNLTPQGRKLLVEKLAQEGRSGRKIAKALGVSEATVRRDLSQSAPNDAPPKAPKTPKSSGCIEDVERAVDDENVTKEDAAAIAGLAADTQNAALASVMSGAAPTLLEAVSRANTDDADNLEAFLPTPPEKERLCPSCTNLKQKKKARPKTCKACKALQTPKQPKSGSIKFDDKKITDELGKLVRLTDDRANALRDKGPKYTACMDSLKNFEAAFRQWRVEG